MAEVGIFMNLPEQSDDETTIRKDLLHQILEVNGGHHNHFKHGAADYTNYGAIAGQLIADSKAKVYIATCWPSFLALVGQPNISNYAILFAGLTDNANDVGPVYGFPNIGGIKSFDPLASKWSLCLYWSAILGYIAPQVTNVGIVYDSDTSHQCMSDQYNHINAVGVTQIYANDRTTPTNPVNQGIDTDIDNFVSDSLMANPNAKLALIVTAGTRTAMLRQKITNSAHKHKIPAIYPNRMYLGTGKATGNLTNPGLLSFGPDLSGPSGIYRDVAVYAKTLADRVQNGTFSPNVVRTEFGITVPNPSITPQRYECCVSKTEWSNVFGNTNYPNNINVTVSGNVQSIPVTLL